VARRPSYQEFSSSSQSLDYTSVGLLLSRRAPRSSWSAKLNSTYTDVPPGWELREDVGFSLRLTAQDQVVGHVHYRRLAGVAQPSTETLGSVRFSHRW
jgi:hypothetical protein